MGNCQAAEAATVVIQHERESKVERRHWSVSAHEVMNANPGHYVALLDTSTNENNGVKRQLLRILRPDDTLLIGQVYRLISFEDVLKEFAAKKCIKLGKLLKERRGPGPNPNPSDPISISDKPSFMVHRLGNSSESTSNASSRLYAGIGRRWKPALQSISETGT